MAGVRTRQRGWETRDREGMEGPSRSFLPCPSQTNAHPGTLMTLTWAPSSLCLVPSVDALQVPRALQAGMPTPGPSLFAPSSLPSPLPLSVWPTVPSCFSDFHNVPSFPRPMPWQPPALHRTAKCPLALPQGALSRVTGVAAGGRPRVQAPQTWLLSPRGVWWVAVRTLPAPADS